MGTAKACNPPHKAVTQYITLCRECMDLLLELDAPVEYIILTTHAYEHKVFVPSFQRRFPQAQVYYSPKCALSLLLRFVQKEGADTCLFIAGAP